MEVWKTVLLGIVEGLTEFLPVSSTGHMILVGHWVDFPAQLAKTFDVFIQLGAILAVVLYYRSRLVAWVRSYSLKDPLSNPIVLVFVAFLPAAAVGLFAHKAIQQYLFFPVPVACALILGGIAIELIERSHPKGQTTSVEEMNLSQAVRIGLFQCLALFPGVSRSAATIMGGLLVGLSLPAATEFSFFLAIPTMVAASGYSLLKVRNQISQAELWQLGLGFVVAFLTALPVVAGFVRWVQSHSFRPFVIYRIVLGILVLVVLAG